MAKSTPQGDWLVYILEEVDMLTNCLKAIAAYRKEVGEYWPAKMLLSAHNRVCRDWGEGITVINGASDARWIINNAIYMSIDDKLYDPVTRRKATTMNGIREPVEDVYQVYYRMRHEFNYIMTLPKE